MDFGTLSCGHHIEGLKHDKISITFLLTFYPVIIKTPENINPKKICDGVK